MSNSSDDKRNEPSSADVTLPETDGTLPPVDFTTFVLSLSTSALVSLGEVPDGDGQKHIDLPLARQSIDLLGMLQEKTKGNLTGEEERLMDQLLLDLRMKFVDVAGQQKKR
jgi:hypothetical protein